ncbi:hypothetical protein OSTOST_24592 [Ostertagia ostertagi]
MKSSSCSICGSTQTTILDGLMYCASCGTQIFDFREVEADEEGLVAGSARVKTKKSHEVRDKSKTSSSGPHLSTSSGHKRRKGEKLEGYCSTPSTSTNRSELAKDYTTGRNYAPAYLRTIGRRISTFTKILAKGAAMISQEQAVPSGFCDNDIEPTSSATPAKQSQLVNVIDTNIPKETLRNAASLFLSLDLLAALLYISTVTIGCGWIMLSDIIRWQY